MTDTQKPQRTATETQVVHTEAGDVHITETPAHKGRKPKIMIRLEPDDLVRGQAKGFLDFLQDYAVVGLALGFIVGQQANGVVKQFVASFLDPLTRVWFGQNLSERTATLHHNQTAVQVPWGIFVFTLIEFFFVLLAMYVIIKAFKLDRFVKKKDKK